ncbi:hypothetical protein [Chamaesiphon sp. VAR_48_metabat_135_sub]|uniref:hypothetical protein n=1 Tax=Chamaesiphon sp. VAR_48_metabat_135_sub TaxID=2964699 RepID=UPI00286BF000|nr:hypothetical protein [Chamaesiphon sp. VAR_48_metabat_135_sub]
MILQDLITLDGKLELYACDGQFLGLLSSDRNDANSIINLKTYGNSQNINSIHYKHGIYGGQYGRCSPYNYRCLYPPSIVFQRQCIGMVSKNKYIVGHDLDIIDPDLLLSTYVNLSEREARHQGSRFILTITSKLATA